MSRMHQLLVTLAAVVCTAAFATKPGEDPLTITLEGPKIASDDGEPYVHDVAGVHAVLPGTGNIVLDPDRGAKGKQPRRWIHLEGLNGKKAFFMSINSVGKTCDGVTDPPPPPARDLTTGQCIQSEVAVNEIEGTDWFLRCGEDVIGDEDRRNLDNVAVTCNDDDGDRCIDWTIAPLDGQLRCAIFAFVREKGKMVFKRLTPLGEEIDMSFTAGVTRP